MLRYFRKPSRSINLWIDAACLDQVGNIAEVQQQVQRMGEIYREAKKVFVWRGEGDANVAPILFTFFRNLEWLEKQISNGHFTESEAHSRWNEILFGPDNVFVFTSGHSLSLVTKHFLDNPWFRRRWVVQGLALSEEATFCVGTERLSSKTLSASFRMIKRLNLEAYRGVDVDVEAQVHHSVADLRYDVPILISHHNRTPCK